MLDEKVSFPVGFEPGAEVRVKSNPAKRGIVVNQPPKQIGKHIRLKVKFDTKKEEFFLDQLEVCPSEDETVSDFLDKNVYGTRQDLLSAVTYCRLSGALDNMIYSLHLSNTLFLPYQFVPLLNFFNSFSNGFLIADEVGLGKTIEAGLIWLELQMREHAQRMLVVCPSGLREKWRMELSSKFSIDAEIVDSANLTRVIQEIASGARRSGVFIAGMQGIRLRESEDAASPRVRVSPSQELMHVLEKVQGSNPDIFNLMIVDEAHHIRNRETNTYRVVRELREVSSNIILLSATPIQTGIDNLFSLLNLLNEEAFPYEDALSFVVDSNEKLIKLISDLLNERLHEDEFKERLDEVLACRWVGTDNKNLMELIEKIKNNITDEMLADARERVKLVRSLRPFDHLGQYMSRTLKRYVQKDRVQRRPYTKKVHLTEAEKRFYQDITEAIESYCIVNEVTSGFITSSFQRQMASSIQTAFQSWSRGMDDEGYETTDSSVDDSRGETEGSALKSLVMSVSKKFEFAQELAEHDSKFEVLLQAIREFQSAARNRKIIIFSFYKKNLRYLQKMLRHRGVESIRIDGDVAPYERIERIQEFRFGTVDVLLTSEVSAEGIDLQFSNCLINYDLPWNPAKIEQRIGRIDRIGQECPAIHIVNLVLSGTIEEKIYDRLLMRLRVFERALGVAERILGEEIDKLGRELFSAELTPEEVDRRIENTELALANLENQRKDAEEASVVFEMFSRQIQLASELERYVLDEDLFSYVNDLCLRFADGSKLVRVKDDLYRLDMSDAFKVEFNNYLTRHSQELETTELFSMNQPPLLRFKNKKEPEPRGVERVTQLHPLIRFVGEWRREKNIRIPPLAAARLNISSHSPQKLRDLSQGVYVFRLEHWMFSTGMQIVPKNLLAYSAISLKTGEELDPEVAEVLVNYAGRHGNSVLPGDIDSSWTLDIQKSEAELDLSLSSRCEGYFSDCYASAENDSIMKKHQLLMRKRKINEKYQQSLESLGKTKEQGRKGRAASLEKNYKAKIETLDVQIKKAEMALESIKKDRGHVMSGIVILN